MRIVSTHWLLVGLLTVSVCVCPAETVVNATVICASGEPHADRGMLTGSDRFLEGLARSVADDEDWAIRFTSTDSGSDFSGYDLIFGASDVTLPESRFRFSKETLLSTWGQVLTTDGRSVNTFVDLENLAVGLVQDDTYNRSIRSIMQNLNIECRFVEFSDYFQIIHGLEKGWIDAGVIDHLHLQDRKLSDDVVVTPVLFAPAALRVAQPLGADSQLLDVVDYHLAELKKNPSSIYYKLMEDLLDRDQPALIPPVLGWLLGGALLLTVWFGGFSWILQRRVRSRTRELFSKNEQLEESQNRLQMALDVANDGLWDWRIPENKLYLSPRWYGMLGYQTADLRQDFNAMMSLVHPDDRVAVELGINALLSSTVPRFRQDFRIRHKEGYWKWVAVRAKPVERDEKDRPLRIVGTTVDIDSRKQTEFELEEARQRAEAANVAKSAFLAHMSHELRTPLNAVIGLTSLLLRSDMDDEQMEYVKTVQVSGEMLLTVINDILDLSKVEAGELQLEKHIFDLRKCVESVIDLAAPRAAEKQLELSYHVENNVPRNVTGDVVRMRQVLLNLLNNAVKFTEEGEVALTVEPEETSDPEKCRVRMTVRDTGVGMTEAQLRQIFRPFRQADSSTTRRYGGTGLGLTICDKLVRLMNGSFSVSSTPGEGSSFSFYVEFDVAPPSEEEDASLRRDLPELKDKLVLVVDDNKTNRCVVEKHLRLWGAEPVLASTGFEALVLLEQRPPFTMVLLDMFMPGMDGLELTRAVRERPAFKDLPLVMLTSSMGHDEEFRKMDYAAVLFKPIKPSVLCKTMMRILSNRPEEDSPDAEVAVPVNDHRPLRILLAEDNLVNQKVCQLLLKKLGYTADVVVNGEEVLRAVDATTYDVILMDVQMPRMDGLAATRELCGRYSELIRPYIIGVSAHAMPEERERALSEGMNDYLSKPIHMDELRYALLKVPFPAEPEPTDFSSQELCPV